MFIGPKEKTVIEAWSQQNGWSLTIAKRNYTVYRALEWLAATLDDQIQETAGWFWCQQERIAASTGLSRPTVRAAITALVDADWIEHERRWLAANESQCSWFRLKLPSSCAGRVRKAAAGVLNWGMTKPPTGMEKSSRRRVKNLSTPSYMSKRERTRELKAETLGEIQTRCLERGLVATQLPSQLAEIAETVFKARQRKLRSAGVCDPLDVKLAKERAKAGA